MVSFPQVSPPKPCIRLSSSPPHTCYTSHPSHSSRFYDANDIGWGVQIIYVVFSTPLSSRPSCAQMFSSTPSLQTAQPTFLPQCERPSFIPLHEYFKYLTKFNCCGSTRWRIAAIGTVVLPKGPGVEWALHSVRDLTSLALLYFFLILCLRVS